MGSPEVQQEGSAEDAEKSDGAKVDWMRKKLANKVKMALMSSDENARFNEHDATEYLKWVQSETDVTRLQQADTNFGKTVDYVKKINTDYEVDMEKAAEEGLFAEKSIPLYMKWWRKLTDQQRINHLKNKDTDLHNPRRKELRDIMDPDMSPPPVADQKTQTRLPQAIRKQYWKEFLKGDLQEREALVAKLVKSHIELKNAFLELPTDVQKKYMDEFANADLNKRKELLRKIQKETGQKVLDRKEKPENESARLDKSYKNKIDAMTNTKPIPRLSKGTGKTYAIWFKGLSLEEKKTMLHHSELDSRIDPATGKNLRVVVCKRFEKLPADVQAKHRETFIEADVDRRLQILEGLENPEKAAQSEGESVEYTPDQIKAAIEEAKREPSVQESLLVTNLVDLKFEQHKRARQHLGISATAKSELVIQKAEEKGMKKHEVDLETKKALAKNDKRSSSQKTNISAFSAVEKMRQERIRMAQESEQNQSREEPSTALADARVDEENNQNQNTEQRSTHEIQSSTGDELVEDLQQVGELDGRAKDEIISSVGESAGTAALEGAVVEDIHVRTLDLNREARNLQRKGAAEEEGWNNHNLKNANSRFWNEVGDKELSAKEFEEQVLNHRRAETSAKLMPHILRNLPGASTKVLEAALKEPDALHVDFRKAVA